MGSLLAFRVGAADATYLCREFAPVFSATDLIFCLALRPISNCKSTVRRLGLSQSGRSLIHSMLEANRKMRQMLLVSEIHSSIYEQLH